MSSPSVGQLADNVTDVVGEALSTGKGLATDAVRHLPDVTESLSDIARSTASTVADLATTAIALAPFTTKATSRRRPRWPVAVAIIAVLIGLAWWKRSRSAGADVEAEWGATSNVAPLTPSGSAATA